MALLESYEKRPEEKLDYSIDFSDYLTGLSDTLSSYSLSVDTGITVVSDSEANNIVTVWLEDGTKGNRYKVSATITTGAGRRKTGAIEVIIV